MNLMPNCPGCMTSFEVVEPVDGYAGGNGAPKNPYRCMRCNTRFHDENGPNMNKSTKSQIVRAVFRRLAAKATSKASTNAERANAMAVIRSILLALQLGSK
jgi:transposase-like protein